jgi:hypothetical protein
MQYILSFICLDCFFLILIGFIERNGAAQGLSEVIAVISENRFKNELLPTILQQCDSEKPVTREG